MKTTSKLEIKSTHRKCRAIPFALFLVQRFVPIVLMLFSPSLVHAATTNDVGALLQKGLFEEEANRNLDAAIQAYQTVINETDKHHQFAATAIFRLAECYRKQGKTQEASALYERILREFPDQTDLVKLSEQQVGHAASPPSTNGTDLSGELLKQVLAAQTEADSCEQQLGQLKDLSPGQLRVAVQQSYPNPVLNSLMQKLTETEQDLARLKNDLGDNHPDVVRANLLLKSIQKQLDDQTDGVLRGLAARMQAARETAKQLEERLQQARLNQPSGQVVNATATESAKPVDPEAEEIQRLQAMIKDSPDLVNGYAKGSAENPLLSAVLNGRLKVATFLLDHKASLEARVRGGNEDTPLLVAAKNGSKEMVELLLNRGANVNAAATRSAGEQVAGDTALHYAAAFGFKSVAEAVLAHGANIDARNVDEQTPLHLAAQKGFQAVAELLLARGADPNLKDDHGDTPLHLAAQADNEAMVELLLANKADVNSKDKGGMTALHLAASKDRVELAKLLLIHGADINPANGNGSTPLILAAETGGTEMIKLLLANKADLNAQRNDGWSALLNAVSGNRLENARLLLARGAQVDVKSDRLVSPLHLAIARGSVEMIKAILEHKPDLEILDEGGSTPLQEPVWRSQVEIVSLLLDAGADPNVRFKGFGNASALELMAQKLNKPMVELLLAHKADPNLQDRDGNTALSSLLRPHSANESQKAGEIANLLRRAGADETLHRRSAIGVNRGDFEHNLFFKGTNSYNRYTLFELLKMVYGPEGKQLDDRQPQHRLPFPDFSRIRINRLNPNGGTTEVKVNLLTALQSGDCSSDQWLEWGDLVEIPEQGHDSNVAWFGLTIEAQQTLGQCLTRSVEIITKDDTLKVTLSPGFPFHQARVGNAVAGTEGSHITLTSFDLKSVIIEANVIRASSDLSHVKIKRLDPVTKKPVDVVLNLDTSDFWLRDGDVIEIPEKP